MKQVLESLRRLSAIKQRTDDDYVEWLQFADVLQWLGETSAGLIPIAVLMEYTYVYSVLVPRQLVNEAFVEDVARWNFPASSGWGYSMKLDASTPDDVEVSPPLESTGSQVLDHGEPLVFLRYFEGYRERKGYLEVNQRMTHILGVHYMESRSAHSRLDENGDFEDVMPISSNDTGKIVSVDFEALEPYMLLTDSMLVRLFDIPRAASWANIVEKTRSERWVEQSVSGVFGRLLVVEDDSGPAAGKLRGFQIIDRQRPDKALLSVLAGKPSETQRYESFIAWDWKKRRIHKCSCNPASLGNYFVKSDLPYGTSPAFFRPDVLAKYKQDPDKYEIEPRMISCRGGWYLQYDINTEGQVHVYLIDLSRLPHMEQQYWKSFNEKPRAGLSKRAYTTDFQGEWNDEYDPLFSLKRHLSEFPATESGLVLWKSDRDLVSRLAHVTTESKKEWEDAILNLAKLLVDGLQPAAIGQIATVLGCCDRRLGSVKQLKLCLQASRVDETITSGIANPLLELWTLRSKGIAHRGTSNISQTRAHFRDLLARCDRSVELLSRAISEGVFEPRGKNGDGR